MPMKMQSFMECNESIKDAAESLLRRPISKKRGEELEQGRLNPLLRLKCHDSITDAVADLGGKPDEVGQVSAGFQKYLHVEKVA